jgi:hypothetical protein
MKRAAGVCLPRATVVPIDEPPPGETGRELTGGDAFASLHESLLALTTSAGLKLEVREMNVRRFNGKAIVYVGFTDGRSVTLRVAMRRVQGLRDALTMVLEAGPNGTDHVKGPR